MGNCCSNLQEEQGLEYYDDFEPQQNRLIQARAVQSQIQEKSQHVELDKMVAFRDKEIFVDASISKIQDSTPNENARSSNRLILEVQESKNIKQGLKITLNERGIVDSLQKSNQAYPIYFGIECPEYQNDFNFNIDEGISKRHFEITYDTGQKAYLIRNYNGSGLFIRLEKSLELSDNTVISFGINHLIVNISEVTDQDTNEISSRIQFKVVFGVNKGES